MTNEHSFLSRIKESSLSISLTAGLILVASVVVIISSITIQSAYMWLAVGATAVLFLGFCSCTTCEKTSHFNFTRRGSVHSDSISTISDGRDHFYEIAVPHNTSDYWISDLPPSYAVATAMPTSPENQLPPPYSSVVSAGNSAPSSVTDSSKPVEQSDRNCCAVAIVMPTSNSSSNHNDNNNNGNNNSEDTRVMNNGSVC
ncbi:uncharacterized protein [Anabrus simplex]|uniref:uncharacterized protein n=1 Tax=Anabrus simplex TaxID=316456 RepID=UPI0034DD69D9